MRIVMMNQLDAVNKTSHPNVRAYFNEKCGFLYSATWLHRHSIVSICYNPTNATNTTAVHNETQWQGCNGKLMQFYSVKARYENG